MASVTQLQFKISSAYDGGAVDRARASLAALNRDLDNLSNKSVKVTVNVDNSALTTLRAQLDQFSNIRATATATVDANTGGLEVARAQVERFGAMHATAHVDVDTSAAHAGLTRLITDSDEGNTHLRLLSGGAGDATRGIGGIGGAAGGASSGVGTLGSASGAGASSLGGLGAAAGVAGIAIMAIGPIAALTSAAVVGTLGVGFIGLGALILSKTKEIGETMKKFKKQLETDMGQAALAMKTQLLGGINELMVGLHKLTPAFTQAFAASGKLIQPLVQSFLGFTRSVMPGVIAALRAAGPVFDGLRTGMTAFGRGLSTMFAGMAAGAKGAGAALSTALGGIGKILGIVGVAFGQMAAAGARSFAGLMGGLVSLTKGAMAGFVQAVKLMDGALGPFLAALGKFAGQILQGLLPALAALMRALMVGLTPILRALGPVFLIVGEAIVRLGLAFAPLIAVLGQIVAQVITALMPAFKALIDIWSKTAATILVALIPVFIKLMPSIVQVANAFAQLIIAITPLIPVMALFDLAAIKVLSLMLPLVTGLLSVVAVLLGAFAAAIRFTISLFTNWGTTWHTITSGFLTAWSAVASALTASWNAVWNAMKVVATTIWDALKVAWSALVSALSSTWSAFSSAMKTAWQALWSALSTAFGAFSGAMKTAWNAMWSALSTAYGAFSGAMKKAWDLLWSALSTAYGAFSGAMKKAWDLLWSALSTAYGAFSGALKKAWGLLWSALSTAYGTFSSALKKAWDALWAFLSSAFGKFAGALKTATGLLMKAMEAAWGAGAKAIGKAWDAIKKLVRDPIVAIVDIVYTKGIKKLWDGISHIFGGPSLPSATVPVFATGGPVNGPGTGTSDSIPARLSAGEHVWTAAEVRAAGGHDKVAALRSNALGGQGVRTMGATPTSPLLNGRFAKNVYSMFPTGGGVSPIPGVNATGGQGSGLNRGGGGSSPVAPPPGSGAPDISGDPFPQGTAGGWVDSAIGFIEKLVLGGVEVVVGPMLDAVGKAGKIIVNGVIPGKPGMEENFDGGIDLAIKTIKSWITAHDIAPDVSGAANVAGAQKWADAQVGKPYLLGGFGSTFDCSSYMSGIASVILGKTAAPMFTTFAFTGAKTGPATFEKDLASPFMVGVENRGIGHMAGTLNGKNYEATPPRVRSGPGARGAKDAMFDMVYGMKAAIGGGQGVIPTGQHLAIIDAALAAAGVPPPGTKAQWEAGLNTLITRESAWNSSAINKTDSNAAAGHPSQGLAQVIPSTFATYHVAGTSSNILDPIANVAAAIRYIVSRYGNITNVQQANSSLPPKGYWMGTNNAAAGWHRVGERGPEWVKFHGGEKVLPHGRRPDTDDAPVAVHVENHWHGPVTKEALQHAEGPMADKLRMACQAGVGKRRH